MIELVSWNVNRRSLWDESAEGSVDVALLQEAPRPSPDSGFAGVPAPDGDWSTRGWNHEARTCIVNCSGRLDVRGRALKDPESDSEVEALGVSRRGSLTVADIYRGDDFLLTVVSAYGAWERAAAIDEIFADASVHRLLSDIAPLITGRSSERVLIAGDLNILHGYGEHGDAYWAARYQTVFDRAAAMGLEFSGPQAPNGRQANPPAAEMPAGSRDVPTFRHSRQTPKTATRQLDFVFATRNIAPMVAVRALNQPDEWGPSDHCRIRISIDL